jgi:RNA polymerase sigma factor (sigma-70 family)
MTVAELYRLHGHQVYNLALKYVHNQEIAEEITQDVFVAAHVQWDAFQHQAQWSTYLYRITINKCIDHHRRSKKWRFLRPWRDQLEDLHWDHPGIENEQEERFKWLYQALDQLPAKQKAALVLTKLDGKSQKEASEILGIKEKALESLIQRAKQNLKKIALPIEGF